MYIIFTGYVKNAKPGGRTVRSFLAVTIPMHFIWRVDQFSTFFQMCNTAKVYNEFCFLQKSSIILIKSKYFHLPEHIHSKKPLLPQQPPTQRPTGGQCRSAGRPAGAPGGAPRGAWSFGGVGNAEASANGCSRPRWDHSWLVLTMVKGL